MHPPLAQPASTLRLHCVVSQAWPGRVAGLARPCRRPGSTMLQAPPTVSLRSVHSGAPCCRPCAARRVAHCIVAQGAVSHASSAVSWHSLCRIVVPPPTVSCLSRDTTRRPSYNTPIRIATQSPSSQALVRAARPARKLAVSWLVSAISWLCPRSYRGPCYLSMRACCAPCVMIQCTVS